MGSACTTVTGGGGGRDASSAPAPGPQPVAADLLDHAVRHRAGAVAEVELLAGPDPAHGGGVEALVAVDDGQLTDLGQRVDVEQRRGHAPAL